MQALFIGLVLLTEHIDAWELAGGAIIDYHERVASLIDAPFSWSCNNFTMDEAERWKRREMYKSWRDEAEQGSMVRLHTAVNYRLIYRQCDDAIHLLDLIRDVKRDWRYVTTRRRDLRALRNAMGNDLFNRGYVP